MGGESRAFWVWLSVMVIAFSLMLVGLVIETITVHPDAAGFLP